MKDWGNMHVFTDMPDYEPTPATTVAV